MKCAYILKLYRWEPILSHIKHNANLLKGIPNIFWNNMQIDRGIFYSIKILYIYPHNNPFYNIMLSVRTQNYLHDMHHVFKFGFYFWFCIIIYTTHSSLSIYSLIEFKTVFFFYFIFIPSFAINNLSMI